MVPDGKWESAWKAKLSEFDKAIKSKTGKAVDKFINDRASYSSLGGKFQRLDKAFVETGIANQKNDIAALAKAMKAFKSEILTSKTNGELIIKKINSSKNFAKKENPGTVSAFEILVTYIEACHAGALSAYAKYDKDLAHLKNKWSLLSSKDSRDEKELLKFKTMLKKNMLKDVKSALLWIKEQERSPNVEAFNDGIEKETYNIFRYMNEYRAKCDRNSPDFRDVDQAIKPVEKWKSSKTLPKTAGGDHVIVALGKLKKMLADVARWANKL